MQQCKGFEPIRHFPACRFAEDSPIDAELIS
jgi:hypothetical protein